MGHDVRALPAGSSAMDQDPGEPPNVAAAPDTRSISISELQDRVAVMQREGIIPEVGEVTLADDDDDQVPTGTKSRDVAQVLDLTEDGVADEVLVREETPEQTPKVIDVTNDAPNPGAHLDAATGGADTADPGTPQNAASPATAANAESAKRSSSDPEAASAPKPGSKTEPAAAEPVAKDATHAEVAEPASANQLAAAAQHSDPDDYLEVSGHSWARPGLVLRGRYRLTSLIGRGGMADVYRADDQVLNREVAVKIFRPGADGVSDRKRFQAEVRTLAALAHPNLLSLYDGGGDDVQPWCVMNLVDGGTLADVPIGEAPHRIAKLGAQVADGLAYIHERGIVHRDVKPSNVLIDREGDAFLSDFGVAQLLDATRLTATGTLLGTAAYMSPEQVLGREISPAVDIYALGLVLLETLTGVREYPGAPVESAVARLAREPHIPPYLTPEWRQLLRAMTTRESVDRPDAAAVASWLHVLSHNETGEPIPFESDDDVEAVVPSLFERSGLRPEPYREPAFTERPYQESPALSGAHARTAPTATKSHGLSALAERFGTTPSRFLLWTIVVVCSLIIVLLIGNSVRSRAVSQGAPLDSVGRQVGSSAAPGAAGGATALGSTAPPPNRVAPAAPTATAVAIQAPAALASVIPPVINGLGGGIDAPLPPGPGQPGQPIVGPAATNTQTNGPSINAAKPTAKPTSTGGGPVVEPPAPTPAGTKDPTTEPATPTSKPEPSDGGAVLPTSAATPPAPSDPVEPVASSSVAPSPAGGLH